MTSWSNFFDVGKMTSEFFWHDVMVQFFWRYFVSLIRFNYWSKFHVNIITGSGVMTIFLCYKGLTRNLEIGNTFVWVLPKFWRLGRVRDTKFDTNVSNEMLLNGAKCQGYSFYHFWVVKGKLTLLKNLDISLQKISGWGFKIFRKVFNKHNWIK